MATHATSGSTISFGGNAIEGLASITFNHNRSTIDITELGYDYKKYVLGQSDSSATVEVFFDQGGTAQAAIESALNTAGTGTAVVYTAHTGATYTFTAIVTSINYSSPVNDVVRATIELKAITGVTIA